MYCINLEQLNRKLANRKINSFIFFISILILYYIMGVFFFIFTNNESIQAIPCFFIGSPCYHVGYAYLFLLVISSVYFLVLPIVKQKIFYFYIVWGLLSLLSSGMLQSFIDMYNGFFPDFKKLFFKIIEDIENTFTLGWIIILISFPYNIFVLVISYYFITQFKRNY